MRYLSLHLPFLATDRIHRRFAPHDARERRPPPLATIAKVKSAMRLISLDRQALALGLKPGTALADARAMHPTLAVHDADPDGDETTRDALVDWCRLFTPLAAPDADGAMLDISGAAHLFGGETALMQTLRARLARQGFTAETAIAGTPSAAWALARFGQNRRCIEEGIGPDDYARLFAPMPLAALRLDPLTIQKLGQAGLRRIGDLLLRPRAPIAARFGPHLHHRLDGLIGRARDPISPRFAAPPFVAERRFAEGIARREDVEATILTLAHDLCGLLARHGEGARRLDVSLFRVDGIVKHIEAGTSRPMRDPRAMARLFHERIEAAGEDGLDTGYGFDVVRLAALAAEPLDPAQASWDAGTNEDDIGDLVDRLGARFGMRVTRLRLTDTHIPERASASLPVSTKPRVTSAALQDADLQDADLQETAALPERPIRLLDQPELIETMATVPDGPPLRFRWRRVTHLVAAIEGPERIGSEWWTPRAGRPRDYFRAEDTEGRRFWLYREGLYHEAPAPRWYMHGLFA